MLFGIVVTVDSIEVDYLVYILLQECTGRVSGWLVHRTRKHAVGTTGAVIIQLSFLLLSFSFII